MSQDPIEAAYADCDRIVGSTTQAQREHIRSVRGGNEPNLDCEHQGSDEPNGYWKTVEGYKHVSRWYTVWADAFRDRAAHHGWTVLLVSPSFSPGNNPPDTQGESEYEIAEVRAMLACYDFVGINVYGPIDEKWTGSGRLHRIVSKLELMGLGGKRRMVTEVNQVNFAEFCCYASAFGIETAYWFLWRSDAEDHRALDLYNPEANPEIGNRWIYGLAQYQAEAEHEDEAPEPSPEPSPSPPSGSLAERFPRQHAAWVAAGGDDEAGFRRHLWGINEPGLPQPTDDEWVELCETGKSLFEQVKLIGLRRPKV